MCKPDRCHALRLLKATSFLSPLEWLQGPPRALLDTILGQQAQNSCKSSREPQRFNRMLSGSMERTQSAAKWEPLGHLVGESSFQFHWYLHCSLSTQCLLLCLMPERYAWERKAGQEETNPYHFTRDFCFILEKNSFLCIFFLNSLKCMGVSSCFRWERGSTWCLSPCVLLNLFQNSKCIFPWFDRVRTEHGHFPGSCRSWLKIRTWVTD